MIKNPVLTCRIFSFSIIGPFNGGRISRKLNADGRVSRVYLTEKGIKIRDPIERIWKKQQEKLLKGLSADGRKLLNQLLKQMENNLL